MKRPSRILLVENRTTVRNTIKWMLRGLGYEIKDAKSGEIALEELSNTDYDAIILDLGLPGIDGIEMLKRAQNTLQTVPPVVVLTRYADKEHAFAAGKVSAFKFIAKTELEPDTFKEIIIDAVNHNQKLATVKVKRCFKHNELGCNTALRGIPRRLAFVGISFRMDAVYTKGIRPVVEEFKMNCWRAKELRKTGDFTCKLCGMIQESRLALFDISTLNANVLMELGFAFGLGKNVIVLKNTKTKLPVNLGAFDLLQYSTIKELRRNLRKHLKDMQ